MRELLNCLYAQTPGTVLHLDHDAILARCEDQPIRRVPLLRLEAIVAIGRVTITTPLIHRCGHDGITVSWLTSSGRHAGTLRGRTSGNILLRQAQHRHHEDGERRLDVARSIVAGKLLNAARFARHAARLVPDSKTSASLKTVAAELDRARPGLPECASLDSLRGVEGAASRLHFTAVRQAMHQDLGFETRSRRPPLSPFNAVLSFVYGLARGRIEHACDAAGLDPQLGFLHSVRPGRPALALDLLEEHRASLDQLCVTLANRRQLSETSFSVQPGGAVSLTDTGRHTVLTAWAKHLERRIRHRVLREEIETGLVFSVQATLLARHLRGDLAHYLPYVMETD